MRVDTRQSPFSLKIARTAARRCFGLLVVFGSSLSDVDVRMSHAHAHTPERARAHTHTCTHTHTHTHTHTQGCKREAGGSSARGGVETVGECKHRQHSDAEQQEPAACETAAVTAAVTTVCAREGTDACAPSVCAAPHPQTAAVLYALTSLPQSSFDMAHSAVRPPTSAALARVECVLLSCKHGLNVYCYHASLFV